MTTYMIGVTEANLQSLDSLGLWEPLSDYTPYSGRRQRMDGIVVGTGYPTVKWRFTELDLTQIGTLLHYVTVGGVIQASNTVYIKTRIQQVFMTDRVWQNFRCTMITPFEPDDLEYQTFLKYNDVEFVFTHCVEV